MGHEGGKNAVCLRSRLRRPLSFTPPCVCLVMFLQIWSRICRSLCVLDCCWCVCVCARACMCVCECM